MLPPGLPFPKSLHWLGDRPTAMETQHATDAKGCVMYFASKHDCLKFMSWMVRQTDAPILPLDMLSE